MHTATLLQASLARAEMAAQEAGSMGRLREDLRSAVQQKAERLRSAATRIASHIGARLDHSVHE